MEYSFTGVALDDGIYNVEIVTMNVDLTTAFPVKKRPFGLSYASANFGIGDVRSVLCASVEQVVAIPAAALLGLVRSATQTPSSPITCERMTLPERFREFGVGGGSLDELEYPANLVDLDLSVSDVDDITPIANFVGLRNLNLNTNPVIYIGPLSNLINLDGLNLCCARDRFSDPNVTELRRKPAAGLVSSR